MTLYRTSGDSPIVRDLIRARSAASRSSVLVEIKARFDEAANIVWALQAEQAGAMSCTGWVGPQDPPKVALVVRREGSGLRRYVPYPDGQLQPEDRPAVTDLGLLIRPTRARSRCHRACSTS